MINSLNQNFYISRLRRIFPALAILCIICSAWGWQHQLPREYLSNTRHELWSLLFVSNYAFTNERGYFDIASASKPFLHTWSLSIEGQFYLFLPVFLSSIWNFRKKAIISISFSLFIVSLLWCFIYGKIDASDCFYQLPTRAWEFLAGALLTICGLKINDTIFSNIGSSVGLVMLIASACILDEKLTWPGYYTLIPVVGSVLVIASGNTVSTQWLLKNWLLQKLGDISYSLYLWHWPVLVFGKQFVANHFQRELLPYETASLLLLAIIMALLSWKYVETPLRFKKQWWTFDRIWQGASVVLISYVAFTITTAINKGFPNRLPNYVQRAYKTTAQNTPKPECFRDESSKKSAPDAFCQFGLEVLPEGQSPNFLIWGDSHANMYLSALSEAAISVGQSGFIATQTGCRATLSNQPNDLTNEKGLACTYFNNEVNKLIDETPSINTIIIGRMWGGGESFNRTIDLIKNLLARKKNVIVIGPVPMMPFSVSEQWMHLQINAGHPIDNMTIPFVSQQNLFDLQQKARLILSEEIAKGRVIWIDPLEKFCNDSQCVLVNNSDCYFKDVTHLTEAGAKLFTNDFRSALITFGANS